MLLGLSFYFQNFEHFGQFCEICVLQWPHQRKRGAVYEKKPQPAEYQYRQEGVNDYLASPVNIPELIRRIRHFIKSQEQIQQTESINRK